MKYALFLRGINVGGIKVPMTDLRICLAHLKLRKIKTFLQTGNVVFESSLQIDKLKILIEKSLSQTFNYEAHILLFMYLDIDKMINYCPFDDDKAHHRYLLLCQDQSVVEELMTHKPAINSDVEAIAAGRQVVYWQVPVGSTLNTQFSKVIAKPKYKSLTTNRNINTLKKITAV